MFEFATNRARKFRAAGRRNKCLPIISSLILTFSISSLTQESTQLTNSGVEPAAGMRQKETQPRPTRTSEPNYLSYGSDRAYSFWTSSDSIQGIHRVKADNISPAPATAYRVNSSLTSYSNPVGYLDGANCDAIWGWAFEPNQINTPISVDVYDGNKIIATVLANQLRPDVGTALGDNGLHGFSYVVTQDLKVGRLPSI